VSASAAIHLSQVAGILSWAQGEMHQAGADSPRITALALLEHVTGLSRESLLAHPERTLSPREVDAFAALVVRRCSREPLAYILGVREFYGRSFEVSRATLIPRPETEGLVDLALERLGRSGAETARILDVGTGSGAILVTVLAERPQTVGVGTDFRLDSLTVARRNAHRHEVAERLHLVATSLGAALRATFPLIVANLPYVPTLALEALAPEIAGHEPRWALDGGPDGTEIIADLLDDLRRLLAPRGTAIFEIGEGQAETLYDRAGLSLPDAAASVERDDRGIERYLIVERRD
jgi:release factor glutamine methyltransferase